MHHYRCYKIWIKATRTERIADTIAWFLSSLTMPISSSADRVISSAQDLTRALANPSHASPLAHIAYVNRQALHQLSDIFINTTMPSTLVHPPPVFAVARPAPPISILRPLPGFPALPNHPPTQSKTSSNTRGGQPH